MNITKSEVDGIPIPTKSIPGQTAQKRYYDDNSKALVYASPLAALKLSLSKS